MGRPTQVVSEDFIRGLLDTQDETGLEAGWTKFENLRVGKRRGEPRKGMVPLAAAADSDQAAMRLDGAADYFLIPKRSLHTLPLEFTMDIVFQADTVSGTEYLWGVNHANYGLKVRRNGSDIEVLIHDGSNSATVTAGSVSATTTYALRITYDGTTLSVWLHDTDTGASAVTESGTVSGALRAPGGDLLLGADASPVSGFWDGVIEYVRCFSKVMPDFRHIWQYWPHPKGAYVLWDYIPALLDGNNQMIDHSRNLNFGKRNGAPASAATLLDPTDPVQVIAQHVDADNKTRLVVVAGGVPYEETL